MPRDIFSLAFSVNMAASDTAEIMLYGEIINNMPERYKWDQEDKSAVEFDKAVKGVKAKGAKKILLRINSPGGVCTQAVAMRGILANAEFEEVKIQIEGMCASAATVLATLPEAHVSIYEGSEYMIHNPWCLALGNASDFEKVIDRLHNIETNFVGFYARKTGQSEDQIARWMSEETWFTAEDAVKYGFADELLTAKDGKAVALVSGQTMNLMKEMYKSVPVNVAEDHTISSGKPAEIKEDKNMDPKDIKFEDLEAGNPDLLAQIQNQAIEAERARLNEIDDLTTPGYEDLAAEAKANGTSALDFHKQLVQAMKKKGSEFMATRKGELTPAANVTGGAPVNNDNEEEQIKANAKEIAEFASMNASNKGGMY